jgi:polar amino acid transport system permease protein
MNFFEYMWTILPELMSGLLTTLVFTLFGMGVGYFMAIPLCLISLYNKGFSKKIVDIYVEIIRGTPLLIQLYMLYYGLPTIGVNLSPYLAAMIGFTLNSAAYQIEYMKGGFKAISYEQIEAAYSIGMTKWQAIVRILVPQGLRFSIPALSNELIYLLKYTSLGFIIQAPELMTKAKILASDYARYMDTFLVIALIYVALTFIFSKITDIIYDKVSIPGTRSENTR